MTTPEGEENGQKSDTNPKPRREMARGYWHYIAACGRARKEADLGKWAGRCFCESLCVPTAYVCGIVRKFRHATTLRP
ncbi:hypothetical protein BO78DRAFT_197750 [Aspergillus sclerotiicarbonarius CBS 121057]|uniref:Uncharacterized protein n=1 Tax=Aspergillus sclerotiicarbonarius (strain CBS 121057 / IBT 28362) TaxID=1448318 RepID=A0A319E012_ASPSB|nr:hypothetical protein BO78DRAFT_197750 [Aspergillus sclerotiicarbonarius CBS 121057]